MRPRIVVAAAFVTAVLAACSRPDDRAVSSDAELERELELAIAAASQPDVVSQIEIVRPAEPKKKAPPAKVRTSAKPHALHALPEPEAELTPVAMPAPEPIMVAEPAPISAPVSGPSAAEGDEPEVDRPRGTEERGTRPPIIIIRGGGAGDDPCDIHRRPGRGRGIPSIPEVLINPRVPPMSGPGPGSLPGPMSIPPRVGGGIRF